MSLAPIPVNPTYTLIYDPTTSGDFTGFLQTVGDGQLVCQTAASLPSESEGGFVVTANTLIPVSLIDGSGLKLYAKAGGNGGFIALISQNAITLNYSSTNLLPTKTVNCVIASDGVLIPVDSLATAIAGSTATAQTLTLIYLGNTYIKTITYTAGNASNLSQWVKQP